MNNRTEGILYMIIGLVILMVFIALIPLFIDPMSARCIAITQHIESNNTLFWSEWCKN